ncbi:competence-induced CoiA-like family protein [Rhizobium phaseoli]|uniref:competence protein CoiA n=1 Tax=Rhizobium phaseoli TaxID=396 RepID=UPI0007EA2662|nr:competence protein CoiA family protein [Rhizobium phaseoli]ANL28625.1 competence-induced CoiA-like family protein [Rhizobium phaseoli]ANM04954.1 competence-induced CoiA-like family protein [Rhizobium phaseoli]
MKFAFVDGIRQEATTGVRGSCPGCGSPTLAKCGLKRLHHWAHVSTAVCDRWWEPETEWHRAWKNLFPTEWQEVHHRAADGEVHIADVKTASGTVVEFQHWTISPQERASREAFYGSMIWIVDGTRLKRDLSSFREALLNAPPFGAETDARSWLLFDRAAALIERWRGSQRPVFLDFGDAEFPLAWMPSTGVLWWLSYAPRGRVVATPVYRQSVVDHIVSGTSIRGFGKPMPPMSRRSGRPRF